MSSSIVTQGEINRRAVNKLRELIVHIEKHNATVERIAVERSVAAAGMSIKEEVEISYFLALLPAVNENE